MKRAAKTAAPVRISMVKHIEIVIVGSRIDSMPNVLEACLQIGKEGKSGKVELPGITGTVKVTR